MGLGFPGFRDEAQQPISPRQHEVVRRPHPKPKTLNPKPMPSTSEEHREAIGLSVLHPRAPCNRSSSLSRRIVFSTAGFGSRFGGLRFIGFRV